MNTITMKNMTQSEAITYKSLDDMRASIMLHDKSILDNTGTHGSLRAEV